MILAAVETSELVMIATGVVAALGTIAVAVVKAAQKVFERYQVSQEGVTKAALEEVASSRRACAEMNEKAEKHHEAVMKEERESNERRHAATLAALERIETRGVARAEEDRKTIMRLAGLEKTDTGSFRTPDGAKHKERRAHPEERRGQDERRHPPESERSENERRAHPERETGT